MATDTKGLMTPPKVNPIDLTQVLASLVALTSNRAQNTTTADNSVVQPVVVTPAVTDAGAGPVVNPNASLPPVPPQMPAGNAVGGRAPVTPEQPAGSTAFTDQILAQGQVMPIIKPQALTKKAGSGPSDAAGALSHLATNGESLMKFISAL